MALDGTCWIIELKRIPGNVPQFYGKLTCILFNLVILHIDCISAISIKMCDIAVVGARLCTTIPGGLFLDKSAETECLEQILTQMKGMNFFCRRAGLTRVQSHGQTLASLRARRFTDILRQI